MDFAMLPVGTHVNTMSGTAMAFAARHFSAGFCTF